MHPLPDLLDTLAITAFIHPVDLSNRVSDVPSGIPSSQYRFRIEGGGLSSTLFECSSLPRVPSSLEMNIVPWW